MSAQLFPDSEQNNHISRIDRFTIAAIRGETQHYLIDSDALFGAYSGFPYWQCPELSDLARAGGFADSVLAAYQRHGINMFEHLKGPFSLVLFDRNDDRVLMARDRSGICELYYLLDKQGDLLFGNSLAAVVAGSSSACEISTQRLFDYLYFHMVPGPGTIYEGPSKVEPGQLIVFESGRLTKQEFWRPVFNEQTEARLSEMERALFDIMKASVKRSLDGNPVGCFLSGGIDSSTIAGMLSELQPSSRTFTIGFQEEGYDETTFARVTANHFATDHAEYFMSPANVVDALPIIAAAYDEPFGNSSVVPTYYCAKLARENGISTMLAGDGGDELFGGNVRYVTQQVFGLYGRIPASIRANAIEPLLNGLPGAERLSLTRKMQSYIRQAKIPMPDRLETYNHLSRTPISEVLHPDFHQSIDEEAPLRSMRETYSLATASSMLNKMLQLDWKYTLADNDLRKVNRMCELAGVNVRYPFLDDELVAFSSQIPPQLKIRFFKLRYFFKHAMRDFLPSEVLGKSKHGFGLPFGVWMQSFEPLSTLAYDCLSDLRKRNIVRSEYLDDLISSHRSSHAHFYGEFIWVLMMLELWLQQRPQSPTVT
jgi:asparagine synthase (glutamine-hydrolysing)